MHFWETNDSNKVIEKRDSFVATFCQTLCGCLWVCHRWKVGFPRLWPDHESILGSMGNDPFTLPWCFLRVGICFCFILFFLFIYCWLLTMEILPDANPKRNIYIYIIYLFFSIFISNETWNASRGISGKQEKQHAKHNHKGNSFQHFCVFHSELGHMFHWNHRQQWTTFTKLKKILGEQQWRWAKRLSWFILMISYYDIDTIYYIGGCIASDFRYFLYWRYKLICSV